jgi:hypothetical protein
MFPFSGFGPFDHTERKALLCAAVVSILFIFVFALARPRVRTVRTLRTEYTVPPPTTPYKTHESEFPAKDLLEEFRVPPEQFEQIDFRNFSYGRYSWPDGRKINLRLDHSVLKLPDNSWFLLKDVYYRDVTGDGLEEAIVWLTHLHCNAGPCDGPTDLFYIYTMRKGLLKPIWEYETGSYAQGCGLRSLTLWKKQINLMMFGECPKPANDQSGPPNYIARGFTHILLEFDGWRFTQKSTDFYVTPATDLNNYEPAININ